MSNIETDEEMQAYNIHGELLTFKFRKSKSKFIGNTYITNSGEQYVVLGNLNIKSKRNKYNRFLVKFKDNTQMITHGESIKIGAIKNPNTPSVYDVGFIGQGKYRSKSGERNTKEYEVWRDMLKRCYSEKELKRKPYYKGCTVDPHWHNFQNFCEDIVYLQGYEEWKKNTIPYKYALDKDIKIEGNKVYNRDTCMFVTTKENSLKANLTGKTYEATNIKTGEKIIFYNQNEFAKKYNLNCRHMYSCIKGDRKSHKEWAFREIIKNEKTS